MFITEYVVRHPVPQPGLLQLLLRPVCLGSLVILSSHARLSSLWPTCTIGAAQRVSIPQAMAHVTRDNVFIVFASTYYSVCGMHFLSLTPTSQTSPAFRAQPSTTPVCPAHFRVARLHSGIRLSRQYSPPAITRPNVAHLTIAKAASRAPTSRGHSGGGTSYDTTHGSNDFAADDIIDCPAGASGISS
eukprot:SAG22_NODE_2565_length_2435_cov_1.671233_3_plen_188_part_00